MEKEFSILVLNACYRASKELGEIGVMFEDSSPDKHVKYQIGMAIAEIGQVAEKMYEMHPDLKQYIEGRIKKYGRVS